MRLLPQADGTIDIDYDDPGEYEFGLFLKLSVNYSLARCLDALQMADDVLTGRSDQERFEAETNIALFTPEMVVVTATEPPLRKSEVPSALAVRLIEDWWRLIAKAPRRGMTQVYRPDLPYLESNLVLWEETWGRRHPYRGRLGIPA